MPSRPVTPAPAAAGPMTGGQCHAQLPVHLDVVEVSGANQYTVKPLESVSTVMPPILLVCRTVPATVGAGRGGLSRVAHPAPAAAASTATAAAVSHW